MTVVSPPLFCYHKAMNTEISNLMERICIRFGNRIVFLGLQGSYARGEEKDTSDIDIVLILEKVSTEEIKEYRDLLDKEEHPEKLCGFFAGKEELLSWEKSDLLSLYLDSRPYTGSLEFLKPLFSEENIENAVRTSASAVYHAAVHNMLHARDEAALTAIRKAAAFGIRLDHYRATEEWIASFSELKERVSDTERKLLFPPDTGFDEESERLISWASQTLRKLHSPV